MFGFGGLSEVLFILFVAMLIFGPEKLPEIGRLLAKGMAEVRKASNELKRTLNAELAINEQEQAARRAAQQPSQAYPAAVPPPPPAWSGGPTVPQLDAPGTPAAPANEALASEGAASSQAAESSEAAASSQEAESRAAAAESSDAAYLADWPEDGSTPLRQPPLFPPAHQKTLSEPLSDSDPAAPSPAPDASLPPAGTPAPMAALAAAPSPMPALQQPHGEGDGRDPV